MKTRASRSVLGLGFVVLLLAGFAIVRVVTAAGFFASSAPVSPGACRPGAALDGARAMAADAARGTILVASRNRIALVKTGDPNAAPVTLAGTPSDFHPVSISLYRAPDGSETLMAVNAKADGHPAVDIFGVDYKGAVPKLEFRAAIEGGLLTSGGGIFAISPDHFYVANNFSGKSGWMQALENGLVLPLSNLLYFDGVSFRAQIERLAYPTAVWVPANRANIYVASADGRRLLAFSREPFGGTLTQLDSLALPMRPQNIVPDGNGLLVTGPARAGGASQVVRVTLARDGTPQSFETLYAGDAIAGATASVRAGGRLFIAAPNAGHLLVCGA